MMANGGSASLSLVDVLCSSPTNDVYNPASVAVVDWLIDGARGAEQPQDVLQVVCDRLRQAGLPLDRVAVFVRTLHPNVMGRRFLWEAGEQVVVSEGRYDILNQDIYRRSSVVAVYESGEPVRRRLADPDCPSDFNIITDLRAEGFTDYLIQPLHFLDGQIHAVSWCTKHPDGFEDADLVILEAVCRPLARIAEIYGLRRTTANLLDTYVGRQTGKRILAGQIRRGDINEIPAVIFLSDLRGFTKMSEELAGHVVVEKLNDYFDCLVPAIESRGGEILKFIGDGLLAIFPADDDAGPVCRMALDAIEDSRTRLASLAGGGPRYGMALHLGDVLYGNVGSEDRLDFTTIGLAVNRAARLEGLARDVGQEVIISAEVARHCPDAVRSLGRYQLRGIESDQEVFTLAGR
ncbi:MAG: adenylate/guanylate cyclase domain-containing protein [Pseudomonadota bacterium]